MTNKMKIKGSAFERQAVEILNTLIEDAEFKKVPGSGALGTSLFEPLLTADIVGRVKSLPKSFKIECKTGYNNSAGKETKQLSLKKLWLDKLRMEADQTFSIPIFLGKFENVREGVKVFAAMDVEVFAQIINHITMLQKELNKYAMSDKTSKAQIDSTIKRSSEGIGTKEINERVAGLSDLAE